MAAHPVTILTSLIACALALPAAETAGPSAMNVSIPSAPLDTSVSPARQQVQFPALPNGSSTSHEDLQDRMNELVRNALPKGCTVVIPPLKQPIANHPRLKKMPPVHRGHRAADDPAGTSHCTATINGRTVYDGPGSSVTAEASSDGKGTHEKVEVDGKVVLDH